MKARILEYKLYILGALLGAIGGYLYWNFVGCSSGSCAITSNPFNSTLYGAMMGALALSLLKKENPAKEKEKN
jgi:hypothetical protein